MFASLRLLAQLVRRHAHVRVVFYVVHYLHRPRDRHHHHAHPDNARDREHDDGGALVDAQHVVDEGLANEGGHGDPGAEPECKKIKYEGGHDNPGAEPRVSRIKWGRKSLKKVFLVSKYIKDLGIQQLSGDIQHNWNIY